MAGDRTEKALKRYAMVVRLLDDGLDAFERRRQSAQIMEEYGISGRSLRRYVQFYKKAGYKSLEDIPRSDKGSFRDVPEAAVCEAVKLRQELPSRSVRRIIEILEGEKIVKPGEVSRTSLNRHLIQRGYGAGQLRAQGKATQPAGRYQRKGRNGLFIADVKYGPMVVVGGKKKKTYLLAIIDDATRMIMHAEFYDNQRLPILEDCFRKALLKFGKPTDFYVDNGKIFVSKWFRLACARLGIRHISAPVYSAKSKGKVEKFNNKADEFINEFGLEAIKTLPELNRKFAIWMDEGYTHDAHGALAVKELDPDTGRVASERKRTPYQAYTEDPAKVRYVSSLDCREAFLWEESRTADGSGCVKLAGLLYDAGPALARKKVDVRYDPFDISVIEIWQGGKFQRKAERLEMPEFLPRNEKPGGAAPAKATHSRLLKVYEEKNAAREKQRNGALDFHGTNGGGKHE